MDIEGTMQFILDQQAHTHSILERTNETLANTAERQDKLEQVVLELGQALLDIANAQQHASEKLATLAERQVDTEEFMNRLAEQHLATEEAMNRLAERQATTTENLNVLLLTVERHISNHN